MNEQQAKEVAQQAIGVPMPNRPRQEAREMRIEAMEGGFVVLTLDQWHNHERRIIPNADCLGSFVQKWLGEGQQRE